SVGHHFRHRDGDEAGQGITLIGAGFAAEIAVGRDVAAEFLNGLGAEHGCCDVQVGTLADGGAGPLGGFRRLIQHHRQDVTGSVCASVLKQGEHQGRRIHAAGLGFRVIGQDHGGRPFGLAGFRHAQGVVTGLAAGEQQTEYTDDQEQATHDHVPYIDWLTNLSIWSVEETTLAFISYARWVAIMLTISSTTDTLELSRVRCFRLPSAFSPGTPSSGWPDAAVSRNRLPPMASRPAGLTKLTVAIWPICWGMASPAICAMTMPSVPTEMPVAVSGTWIWGIRGRPSAL